MDGEGKRGLETNVGERGELCDLAIGCRFVVSVLRRSTRGVILIGAGWNKEEIAELIDEREELPVLELAPLVTRSALFLMLNLVPPAVMAEDAAEASEKATEPGREGGCM